MRLLETAMVTLGGLTVTDGAVTGYVLEIDDPADTTIANCTLTAMRDAINARRAAPGPHHHEQHGHELHPYGLDEVTETRATPTAASARDRLSG